MIIWKNTCGESWQDTIENGWEVSGKPGAFLFFIPKGALTHHLLKQAVAALPLVGLVRSPRGIASPAGAAGRCHGPVGSAVIVHAVIASTPAFASVSWGTVCTPPCANCLRKPATGSFIADMGIATPATPIFFLRKRNKNKGKVKTNGDLPFGSKSGQPGQWTFCCCRFRLFELFQNFEWL